MKYKPHNDIKEILWMARRYADWRQTYCPSMFNDAYQNLRDNGYVVDERIDDTIPTFPIARYGSDMVDEQLCNWLPRKYCKIDKALEIWIWQIEDGKVLELLPRKDLHTFLLGLRERLKNQ